METLYYEFYDYGAYRGIITISLENVSKNNFIKYIDWLHKQNSNLKYKECGKHLLIKYSYYDFSFLRPEVLFSSGNIRLDIVNIFGNELKLILQAWIKLITTNSQYFNFILNSLNNFDNILDEAIIKNIIE